MSIRELQSLFVRDLVDAYAAERLGASLLEDIAESATDPDVINTLQYHAEETRQHISNLERVFKVLGTKAEDTPSIVARAIKAQYESFVLQEDLSPEYLMMFGLDTVARIEHFEIASYRGLVRKAVLMGEMDCAQLLDDILTHEKQMARSVQDLSERLGRQLIEKVTA